MPINRAQRNFGSSANAPTKQATVQSPANDPNPRRAAIKENSVLKFVLKVETPNGKGFSRDAKWEGNIVGGSPCHSARASLRARGGTGHAPWRLFFYWYRGGNWRKILKTLVPRGGGLCKSQNIEIAPHLSRKRASDALSTIIINYLLSLPNNSNFQSHVAGRGRPDKDSERAEPLHTQ